MRISKLLGATVMFVALPAIVPAQSGSKHKSSDTQQNHLNPWSNGPSNESDLIKRVRHTLLMLPNYGVFDDLGFRVNGNAITLTGQVTNPTLKADAENAVKRTEGVGQVVNNIEVLPVSGIDNSIRIAVDRAIYDDPSLSVRYAYRAVPAIHIIVKNGDVRLEGIVDNQMDKTLAGMRANGVHGVFKVENDLEVAKSI